MKSFATFNSHDPQKGDYIRNLFNNIASRYDLLNYILSFGIYRLWYRRVLKESGCPKNGTVIDFCTGTGELLILFNKKFKLHRGIGIDISEHMLDVARNKIKDNTIFDFKCVCAEDTGVMEKCDCVTMSFALRNVTNVDHVYNEMARLVRRGGKVPILELTAPQNPIMKLFHKIYLKTVLPCMGWLLSGDSKAYTYLAESIINFPTNRVITGLMRKAGFRNIRVEPLSFGIASLFIAEK